MVLTNFAAFPPNSLPRALALRVIDAFLSETERDWSSELLQQAHQQQDAKKKAQEELARERVANTTPSLALEGYTGKYFDELSGEAQVLVEDGKLVFDYNPRHIGDLEHWHYDTFRVTWRHPIFDMEVKSFLTFYLDDAGNVSELKVTFYDPIHFKKVPEGQ
jgi:hypothetical protein